MTTQGEGLGLDPARTALWLTIGAALLKGLHILGRWVARRFVIPLFAETARAVLAEDLKTLHEVVELSRHTAGQLSLTVLEMERAIKNMERITYAVDELFTTTEDHRAYLQSIATLLDHELPPLPERRLRKGGRSDG